jgi:integrase/recombinase XerD
MAGRKKALRERTPPKEMAKRLVRQLRPAHPDYQYLKKVFQHTRELLRVRPARVEKRLPELLTDDELVSFYEAVWHARNSSHLVMIKLLIFTGVRNAELAGVRLKDVDLNGSQLRIEKGKGKKDRYVLFPKSFRGELAQYIGSQ